MLILVVLSVFLCATASASQGGGGESTKKGSNKKKDVTKKNPGTKSVNTTPTRPPATSGHPARAPSLTVDLGNNVKLELVLIKAGSFQMGDGNSQYSWEKPSHRVTISQPFYLGKYEVTQAQWQAVMNNNPSVYKDCGGNCPVERVSWDDAQEFIKRLNERGDGHTYRLPTEAEWEYAARAGTTGYYAGNLDSMGWYRSGTTHPVGQKQPNAWGVYDMHGNVNEWCQDWYSHDYYAQSPGVDPTGPSTGSTRVSRGGGFHYFAESLGSAKRSHHQPSDRAEVWVHGFRLVRTYRDIGGTPSPGIEALPLRDFEFDVVTVNSSGSETSRRKGQAQYCTEEIAGVPLELVALPGGTFVMGSTEDDREKPPHQVTVGSFYMGKYEVTQAQWRAVARLPKVSGDLDSDPSNFKFKGDNLPVDQVSWEDAMEFCARLSRAAGRTYRLPTEAEWEYACRGGTSTPFAFGQTITPQIVNYNGQYPYAQAPKGTYRETTTPVGFTGVANGFGLFDMHGNVWEWCVDYWHENYNGVPTDGRPWETAGDFRRVLRGGSWGNAADDCRSALRGRSTPGNRGNGIGFRVVAVARTP